ncbi:MAG: T9SS type A sorting domain-containing protein [Ferruginibacter sp.]
MLRFVYYLLFINLMPLSAWSQREWVSASIGQGSWANSISLYIRTAEAFDASLCNNAVFTIRVPLSARQTPDFTELYHAPAFEHLRFNMKKLNVTDGTYDYYLIVGNGNAQTPVGQVILPDVPFRVLEIGLSGGNTNGMALVNLDNDIPGNNFIRPQFYIQTNLGDISRRSALFFETGTAEVVNNEPGTGNDWVNMQTPASEQAQFISFRVDEQGQDALLNWQVINESVQTREYVIERRTKGQGLTEIGTIQARQNNSVQTYRFTDGQAGLIAGREHIDYRIRETDNSGRMQTSSVETARFGNIGEGLAVYPNPAINSTILHFHADRADRAQIIMHTSAGKQVYSFTQPVTQGENKIILNLKELPAGRYSLILTVNGTRKSVQIVKPVL